MPEIGSGISFEFDWQPSLTLMASQFDTLGTSIKSFKEPLTRSVKEVIIPSIGTNFDVGGRPAWAPLADFTIANKGSSAPLIDTGKLLNAATALRAWTIDGVGGEARLDNVSVTYGYYHQGGFFNVRTGRMVPARVWADIQEQDADRIEEIFWEWLEERFDRDVAMGRI